MVKNNKFREKYNKLLDYTVYFFLNYFITFTKDLKMKKKYALILLAMALIVVQQTQSQDLHVSATGTLYVSPKSDINVTGSLEVVAGGDVTISSDATHSGSLIVSVTATGDISYQKYIPDADWHFVSAPIETQSINDFVLDARQIILVWVGNSYNKAISIKENYFYAGRNLKI